MVGAFCDLFTVKSWDSERNFRIGEPLEYDNDGFNAVRAFWSCDNKMVIYLLMKAEHPEWNIIRPRSLKAATISALTTYVINGDAN